MSKTPLRGAVALALAAVIAFAISYASPAGAVGETATASNWLTYKYPVVQPGCTGVAWQASYFDRTQCGFAVVTIAGSTATSKVSFELVGPDGAVFATRSGSYRSNDCTTGRGCENWSATITPTAAWPAGKITLRALLDGVPVAGATGALHHNQLGASVEAAQSSYKPGEDIAVTGDLYQLNNVNALLVEQETNVPGTFKLQLLTADGSVLGTFPETGAYTANKGGDGKISETIPGSATAALEPTAANGYSIPLTVKLVDASYRDAVSGAWGANGDTVGTIAVADVPATASGVVVENSFVSSVGWVKPGASYPFRVFVKNTTTAPVAGATVTIPQPGGARFTQASPVGGGTASVNADGSITWTVGDLPAATEEGPAVKTLVVEGRAATLAEDPEIVWKDISSTAKLTYTGGPAEGVTSTSHGPKVIPQRKTFDTARYGDRPFAVVPVDYQDHKHEASNPVRELDDAINSRTNPGSTFNLFQEMSYGQLFPHGTIPSAGVETAGWDVEWSGRYAGTGWQFTSLAPAGTCRGTTLKDTVGNSVTLPHRIEDGWYQLPGTLDYYGDDKYGTAVAGAQAGVGLLMDIDSACGPTGKLVYDAAHIADPDIDYSDYDTDKDGVVDFFMAVFAGLGGNGDSQINGVPSYDNVWPHSSSLEFYYEDKATGLKGYVSDDQLKNLKGEPLWYTDAKRQRMTTDDMGADLKVWVRVGPYNVNPETAIDRASVISHEYGHSLGLPDYYSMGSRETYGDWNLMATDKSQHMDVNAKQELGWLVPRVLKPGSTTLSNWQDSKRNTHRIDWVRPDGTPYALTGPNVNNGEAYVAKLPARKVITEEEIANGGSGTKAWWSSSGNDFGCAPEKGHNLDVLVTPSAASGDPITVSFASKWDIEWDYDYGFVMVSTDEGETWKSLASKNGYTTDKAWNPNQNSCQGKYGNGLTGTSGAYASGTAQVDRLAGEYPTGGFLADAYEFTPEAGKPVLLRFSYATDPGLARPGWFIDDLKVTQGSTTLYESDLEADEQSDCGAESLGSAELSPVCADGWQLVDASAGSPADHAYYMEMRDRSGFDLDGKGENDRDPIGFLPGLLLVYTDENHGYGNTGASNQPAQSPVDSQPEPGSSTPNLDDAAFTGAAGDNHYSDSGSGWVDNYDDKGHLLESSPWTHAFDCLTFDVLTMSGDDIGPASSPGNLAGDVAVSLGGGCGEFDYGYVGTVVKNAAPTAVIQIAKKGPHYTFDASASTDEDPSSLTYAWDVDGDGTTDSTASSYRHKYKDAGTYTVTLKVTDAEGATGTATRTLEVAKGGQ